MRRFAKVLAVLMTLSTTGCATLIMHSGIYSLEELPKLPTRQAVRERLGQPTTSAICPDGRSVETFRIARKLARCRQGPCSTMDLLGELYMGVLTLGVPEALYTPVALVKHEESKFEVAFVYGTDDLVVEGPRGVSQDTDANAVCMEEEARKKFYVEIEDKEYPWDKATITTQEIRRLGNLPPDLPVIEEQPIGTERTLGENEAIEIKPGYRLGRAPNYKRG